MAWFNKEEAPQEIKELTPEQIVAKIQESDRLKADLAARDTELTTTRGRVTELETEVNNRRVPPPSPDEPATIFGDPDRFVGDRMAPVTAVAMHAGKMAARMAAVQTFSREDLAIFRKYEADISKLVDGMSPQNQIMPNAWVFALNQIKGQNFDAISKAKSENSDFFAEVPTNNPPPPPSNPDKLNDEELAICRKMNITPERYLAQRKAMKVHA